MKKTTTYKIIYPKGGLKVEIGIEGFYSLRYFRLINLLLVTGMLTFLTIKFLQIFPIFIIFIIPFYCAWTLTLVGNINSFTETQTIEIDDKNFTIIKKRAIWPYKIDIPISEIIEIDLKPIETGLSINKFKLENWLVWLKLSWNSLTLPVIRTQELRWI
jgi:hypothetical protein